MPREDNNYFSLNSDCIGCHIDWGLAGTKQVMESEFSPKIKQNQWSITVTEKWRKGWGIGSRERGQKGESQLRPHGWNVSQRPAVTLTLRCDQLDQEGLNWGIRWDGRKVPPLSLAPNSSEGNNGYHRPPGPENHLRTEGPGRDKERLPLWHTWQVRILPK